MGRRDVRSYRRRTLVSRHPTIDRSRATAKAGQDSGPWTWKGASFPKDGNGVGGSGSGNSHKDAESGHWTTTGEMILTDGRKGQLTGEFDLASRTWSGETDWS